MARGEARGARRRAARGAPIRVQQRGQERHDGAAVAPDVAFEHAADAAAMASVRRIEPVPRPVHGAIVAARAEAVPREHRVER